MSAVCLDILPSGIYYLLAKNTNKGHLPSFYGFIPLPEGSFSNGEVLKKEPIVKVLQEIKNKTKASFARLSIPEEKTYIFKTHLPVLKSKEITDVLEFKIEENVPLSTKEAVFDYEIIPSLIQKGGLDIVVSVAPLKNIEELQSVLNSAGLTPTFFSPESSNIARSVLRENNQRVVVIVNIKESNIVLSLVINGVVCQTSSIGFGGSSFTNNLSKYLKVSTEEAVKIKNEKLLVCGPDSLENFSYIINTVSDIKDEIYKFISYYNQREDVAIPVDRIILCGQDALIAGLDKYLSFNLNIKVEVANIWVNNFDINTYTPEINRTDSFNLAVVNGLSLF
jgi:type IV pilus assembly protein PilM